MLNAELHSPFVTGGELFLTHKAQGVSRFLFHLLAGLSAGFLLPPILSKSKLTFYAIPRLCSTSQVLCLLPSACFVCSSVSGVTLFSPEIFLKPQPADLWSLCFLYYFISNIIPLTCLILECSVIIIPGVQPPFLYPPSCPSYPLQIKPQSAKLSWNSFKIYIIKMWNGCL